MIGVRSRWCCSAVIAITSLLAAPSVTAGPRNVLFELERVVYGQAIHPEGMAAGLEKHVINKGGDGGAGYSAMHAGFRPIDSSLHYFSYRFYLAIAGGDTAAANQWFSRLELKRLTVLARQRLAELERTILTPLEKVFEQRIYWEVFDAIAAISLQTFESRVDEVTHKRIQKAVRHVKGYDRAITDGLSALNLLIHRLRLESREIEVLRAQVAELDPFRDIARFTEEGTAGWLKISSPSRLTSHAAVTGGRSYFESYVNWPSSDRDEQLQAWITKVSQGPGEGSATLPKPANNTAFALVRRMLAIDDKNQIVDIPIPEEVALRVYKQNGAKAYDVNQLYLLDIWASRTNGRPVYKNVSSESALWFGLLIGAPDPISANGRARLTTLDRACASCHNFAIPGAGDAISLFSGETLEGANHIYGQEKLTIYWKERTKEGALLQHMLASTGR